MENIQPVLIPESYASFAKACAALADSHNVTSFQMKITPNFRDELPRDVRIQGDVQFNYCATDGRGRPSRSLSVYLTTNTQLIVIDEPKS